MSETGTDRTSEPAWRRVAAEMLPELLDVIREAENPYLLWIDLRFAFEDAYREPRKRSLIKRIYAFADWCEQQPRGDTAADDLLTCVTVCFYEHIIQIPDAAADMPNWFTEAEFDLMRPVFRYHGTEEEVARVKAKFASKSAEGAGNDNA
jgi:hypothetical protein